MLLVSVEYCRSNCKKKASPVSLSDIDFKKLSSQVRGEYDREENDDDEIQKYSSTRTSEIWVDSLHPPVHPVLLFLFFAKEKTFFLQILDVHAVLNGNTHDCSSTFRTQNKLLFAQEHKEPDHPTAHSVSATVTPCVFVNNHAFTFGRVQFEKQMISANCTALLCCSNR